MTIAQLCSHFEQRELCLANSWRSYSTKYIYKVVCDDRPNFIKRPNRQQFDRDKPNGIEGWSLCTEQAKVTGSQIRWKGATEHGSLALGLLPGCFILKYVTMLHKDAVFNACLVSEI
jgi:hypothetical protein